MTSPLAALTANVDTTYPDTPSTDPVVQAAAAKAHQEDHDLLHPWSKYHSDPATDVDDKHGDRAAAAAAAAIAISTATAPRPTLKVWSGSAYVNVTNAVFYVSPAAVDPRAQTGVTIHDNDIWIRTA
ncbi:MAG: hypothetical protein JWM93_2027 [Frankiales bacterium]|nr:hypothetical protein [Frankiales bacterium]